MLETTEDSPNPFLLSPGPVTRHFQSLLLFDVAMEPPMHDSTFYFPVHWLESKDSEALRNDGGMR